MVNELQLGVISLVKSALSGEKVSLPETFDWERALHLAKKHQIVPMLCYGVQTSELSAPAEVMMKLEIETVKNLVVSENQLRAINKIYNAFDKNEIHYMPLKGSLLKFVYPTPELRPMGDADILIKIEQYEKIRKIMLDLGYAEGEECDPEFIWDKEGTLHLELHKSLVSPKNKDFYGYYGDGWRLAEHNQNYKWSMRDEDNYIYLFTHYAKHYRNGGIGIRHVTDLYVFSAAHPEMDSNYIESELQKLQLLQFYKNTKHTFEVWFNNALPDEMSDLITTKIFGSGSFGSEVTFRLARAVKESDPESEKTAIARKLLKDRIFPPYEDMVTRYKCLEKSRALLPVMWMVRFIQIPFRQNAIRRNVEMANSVSADNVIRYRDELEMVGLKFNLEE